MTEVVLKLLALQPAAIDIGDRGPKLDMARTLDCLLVVRHAHLILHAHVI